MVAMKGMEQKRLIAVDDSFFSGFFPFWESPGIFLECVGGLVFGI
ncbi:hypothetical protein [Methanoregula boonei]|jgi:hypothetical protein|nr:hypothetical protein [Methanoregula boonei]